MSYRRVIPRDLFNEANLFKCYAQIYLNLESMRVDAYLTELDPGESFDVEMDVGTGDTFISNITLYVGDEPVTLLRPINSRDAWPLMMLKEDGEEVSVFNEEGKFSADMISFLEQYPEKKQEINNPPTMDI